MGQPPTAQQPKERRIKNFGEVSLGYSKAVAIAESRRCPQCAQPTCLSGCPLGVDVTGFIRMLREGDAVAALNRIREQNVLPGVCGRICLAPCENACVFNDEDNAIGIRALERYASDNGRVRTASKEKLVVPAEGKKVAVIGSGPSGLTAAAVLARKGYRVTIYEAMAKPGGILRYGVPEFRLPQRVLDAEINDILALGIHIETNVIVGQTIQFDELLQGFDAVFLAIGASSPRCDAIAGDHLIGVYYVQEVLIKFNLWNAQNYPKATVSPMIGDNVVVIGFNHAAIDCARLILRLGKNVTVLFPGVEEEIRVYASEKREALEEGIKLETLVNPLEIVSKDGRRLNGIRCERLDFVEEEKGRWDIQPVEGSEFFREADTVVLSATPRMNQMITRFLPGIQLTKEGSIWIDEQTGQTSIDKVFAAGDAVNGAGGLVEAMAHAKEVANVMDRFLSNVQVVNG